MNKAINRIIGTSHIFNAALAKVWDAWADPLQISQWWGPDGFTITIHEMELKNGGEWRLTLHGPDGTNYPNRSIFMEVVHQQKIVFEHFNPHFITTVVFTALGTKTGVDWRLEFETPHMREIVAKAHNAEEGQKQNIIRLEQYLTKFPRPKGAG